MLFLSIRQKNENFSQFLNVSPGVLPAKLISQRILTHPCHTLQRQVYRWGVEIELFVLFRYAVCSSFLLLLQILLMMIKIPFIFFDCNFGELKMSEDVRAVLSFNWGRWEVAYNHNEQIGDNNDVPTFILDSIDFEIINLFIFLYSYLPCRSFCFDFEIYIPQFHCLPLKARMYFLSKPVFSHEISKNQGVIWTNQLFCILLIWGITREYQECQGKKRI